jgi:hypothetical protein
VRRHGLGVFEGAAFLQIGGDAGRPESVAANWKSDTGFESAFSDCSATITLSDRIASHNNPTTGEPPYLIRLGFNSSCTSHF